MATPVRAAVAADNLRKDRRATLGLRVTLRPVDTALLPEEFFILLLAIDFSPFRVESFYRGSQPELQPTPNLTDGLLSQGFVILFETITLVI
jgi:hypothetical protein